jgi:CDP-diacylglycerol--glycerol-3-phosphate 3-phosphatidyltransferase
MREFTKATRIRRLKVWTIANVLSFTRILLIPVVYHFLREGGRANEEIALGFMFVAAFTDIFDGIVARRLEEESSFGKILDPVADKICIAAMVIILVTLRGFPLWLVGVILFRDLLIVTSGLVLIGKKKVVLSSNWLGKLTTHFMALLILTYTVGWYDYTGPIIAGALFFLVASTASYGISMYHQFYSCASMELTEEKSAKTCAKGVGDPL